MPRSASESSLSDVARRRKIGARLVLGCLCSAAGVVALLIAVAPASGRSLVNCGQHTTVRDVGCKTARKLVSSVDHKCLGFTGKVCRVRGFACVVRSDAGRAATLRCTKGNKLVLRRLRRPVGVGSSGPNGLTDCTLYLLDDTGQNLTDPGTTPSPIDGRGVRTLLGHASGTYGCLITTSYELHIPAKGIHGTVNMRIENPLIGSNEWSCNATGSFRCFGPRDGSNLRGSNLVVLYYVCIPGEDVKQLGRHLPGYCGVP